MSTNHTIRDVAREAGVSVATVSRVINNKPDASIDARKRVEEAIDKLGYSRSSQWRQLTTGKSRAISLLFPHTETSPSHIYLDFITGVTTACEERDYRLDLITRDIDTAALLDLYRSSKSDGTILMKVQLNDWRVEFLREMELPFVMIGHTETSIGANFVDYDFEAAVHAGLAHLVSLGHRNIAYVSPTPPKDAQHGPTIRALRAYVAGCRQLVLPELGFQTDQNLRHVHLMTSNMLAEHPEITALMTIREMVETALYSAVHAAGLRVPDDISILGLTTPHGPELTSPALTAMEFPAWSMAYQAGRLMIDELEGVDTELTEILRPPTLVVRGSTSPMRPRSTPPPTT